VPIYTIRRTWGAEALQEDSEMVHVRVIAASYSDPLFLWIRSFGREIPGGGEGICIYEGPGDRELAVQQRLCGLPVDEITEAEELVGSASHRGVDAAPEGWELYWAIRHFQDGGKDAVVAANQPFLAEGGGALWLRSFWEQRRSTSVCIFAAASEQAAAAAVETPGARLEQFAKVETDHPSFWAHMYDTMGLPRHWEEAMPAGASPLGQVRAP
jgi:hypothetical protein